jgi:hypothetical protein
LFVGNGQFSASGTDTVSNSAICPGSFIMTTYYDSGLGQEGVAIMVRQQCCSTAVLDGGRFRRYKFVVFNPTACNQATCTGCYTPPNP